MLGAQYNSMDAVFQRANELFLNLIKRKAHIHIMRRGYKLGWCPICEKRTVFYKEGAYLRDQLLCIRCYSIPRLRALIYVLETHFPNWRKLHIHESSPCGASSEKLARECRHYIATHYFPDTPPRKIKNGYRCENLEEQTFPDESFDLVITQDVLEHVFDAARVFKEIERTLKPGGAHVFTVPWYYDMDTIVRAVSEDGETKYLEEKFYHGNPVDAGGSLVVRNWGRDLCDFIYLCSCMTTTVIGMYDRYRGIEGDLREVFISRKSVSKSKAI